MANGVWFVLARAVEGQENELWEWYSMRHVPDLLAVPGIRRARLWRLQGRLPGQVPSHDTLAMYDLEADDLSIPLKEAGVRMGGPLMPRSPALDSSKTLTFISTQVVEMGEPDVDCVGQAPS